MKDNASIQTGLERLRNAVLGQNKPGSVEGLLAHHVLGQDPAVNIDWQVACTEDWIAETFKPINLDNVAALGYSLWSFSSPQFSPKLIEGLGRIMERDAFKGEHLSIARNPSRLLGIILGSLALRDIGEEALNWCRGVLERLRETGQADFDPLVSYLFYRAFNTKIPIEVSGKTELYKLAFFHWAIRHQFHANELSRTQLEETKQSILFETISNLHFESAFQAAYIWSSVNAALFHALGNAVIQPKHVATVLFNFEAAMKRWRWDTDCVANPIRWEIRGEREVQDIVWLILRSYFPDVVDEDALPKLGHSAYKADFGIGSLKLIVEAKFARSKDDFKAIEKGIQEDCIPYLRDFRYESLIVFIYDDSASVQEHDVTRRALLEMPGVADVVIVSRPSQLPAKERSQERTRRRKGE